MSNTELLNQTEGYNVSDKYNVIPTIDVINEFERYGFELSSVDAARVRIEAKEGKQQHMVRMASDYKMVGGMRPEVIIHNSYDRSKSLQIRVGLFRFVCSNGIVIGENLIPAMKVRHSNSGWQDIINEFVDNYEEKYRIQTEWIQRMEHREMSLDEAYYMAEQALTLRGDNESAVDPLELLLVKRREDKGTDAWSRFNVIQEHIVSGEYKKYQNSGDITKAKVLTSVSELLRVNSQLSDSFDKQINPDHEGQLYLPMEVEYA